MTDNSAPAMVRVLLVEDDDLEAAIITAILEKAGYEVHHESDPVKAVGRLESESFDIFLCDYMMPRMNGLQVLRRARFHWPDSVRMIITSKNDFNIAVEAINQGEIYRFLRKPVDERELVISVRLAVERMRMSQEVERLTEQLRAREAELAELTSGGGR